MTEGRSLLPCCLLAVGLGSILGCSGEPAEIGDGPIEIDRSEFHSYAANWDGYIEAHTFTSGSDRVRVVLDESASGWLQVGDGELLPPPTDPDVGYPEAVREAGYGAILLALYDGLEYLITGARIELERLRFETQTSIPFGPWCELQTPEAVRDSIPSFYSCVPSSAALIWDDGTCTIADMTGAYVPMDCSRIKMCLQTCECDLRGCHAETSTRPVTVDAMLSDDGEELTGTVLLPELEEGGGRTIRLQRVH